MYDSDRLFIVPPEMVAETWPHIEHLAKRFESETQTMTADLIRARAEDGTAQLWGYQQGEEVKGIGVTEICEHHTGRFLRVMAIAGDLDPVLPEIAGLVERWARDMGCVAMEINGRRGWVRVLPGYKLRAYVIEKDLRTVH